MRAAMKAEGGVNEWRAKKYPSACDARASKVDIRTSRAERSAIRLPSQQSVAVQF
jgi:hypothetical protein